jgi:hypothetical protein
MKILIDMKNTPKKNDILVFDGKVFECVNKDVILKDLITKNFLLEERVKILEQENEVVNREIRILKGEE